MEIMEIIKTLGVEIAMCVAMGWWIVKTSKEHREDIAELREAHRIDAKEMREAHAKETDKFTAAIDKMTSAVQELREVIK